jgi:indole-3-glycerol phosphate synthase
VDLAASHVVAGRIPADVIGVSESGLKTRADLQAMQALGYRAFLMGERFMTDADPGTALAGLIASLETPLAHRSLGEGGP